MSLVPITIVLDGGPHDGHRYATEFIPNGTLIVAANPAWRSDKGLSAESTLARGAVEYCFHRTVVESAAEPALVMHYVFTRFHVTSSAARRTLGPSRSRILGAATAMLGRWLTAPVELPGHPFHHDLHP